MLYLGATSGTTVSHGSDIVGPVSSLSLEFVTNPCFFSLLSLKIFVTFAGRVGLCC